MGDAESRHSEGAFLNLHTSGELWKVLRIHCSWEGERAWSQSSPSASRAIAAINHQIAGQNSDSLRVALLHTNAPSPSVEREDAAVPVVSDRHRWMKN